MEWFPIDRLQAMVPHVFEQVLSCLDWKSQRQCEQVQRSWKELLRSRPVCDSVDTDKWTLRVRVNNDAPSRDYTVGYRRNDSPGYSERQPEHQAERDERFVQISIWRKEDLEGCLSVLHRCFNQLPIGQLEMFGPLPLALAGSDDRSVMATILRDLATAERLTRVNEFHGRSWPIVDADLDQWLPNVHEMTLLHGCDMRGSTIPRGVRNLASLDTDTNKVAHALCEFIDVATRFERLAVQCTKECDAENIFAKLTANPRHLRTLREVRFQEFHGNNLMIFDLVQRIVDVRSINDATGMPPLLINFWWCSLSAADFCARFASHIKAVVIVRDDGEEVDVEQLQQEDGAFDLNKQGHVRVQFADEMSEMVVSLEPGLD